jgi:phage shock protein C
MASYKRLYRSSQSRFLGGVAGGLAEYLGVAPALVRIGFIAVVMLGGSGLLAYILMWMLVPRQPDLVIEIDDDEIHEGSRWGDLFKSLLIALPVATVASAFADSFVIFPFVLGLMIGLYYFWKSSDVREKLFVDILGLHRSATNRKLFGVFGGLADKWSVDPTLLRVVGAVAVVAGVGVVIPIYLAYAFFVPVAPDESLRAERVIVV